MIELIQKGGILMYPILFCSLLALGVILERLYHLYRAKIDTKAFVEMIMDIVRRNRIVEALDLCEKTPGPVAQILRAGLLKHDRTRQEIKEAVEEATNHELPRLEQNLGMLSTIAYVAPLLGLLGTVLGMIKAFQTLQEKASTLNPVMPGELAGGIWIALLTTAAGLATAIPAIIAHNYFVSRVDGFSLDMEKSSAELINVLTQRGEAGEV